MPLRSDCGIDISRRRLPHWNQQGVTYFVTFRTADSLPAKSLENLREQRQVWLRLHPRPWNWRDYQDYARQMFAKLDGWLDQGYGACLLRNSEISEIVIKTLRHFDGVRYFLDEHVVMPNHIHTLVMPMEGQPLKNILQTWKSYSSNRINDLLGNQGRFWMAESFDRIVRSWEDLERIRLSIRDNPKKARLRESDFLLGKGIGIKNPRKIAF